MQLYELEIFDRKDGRLVELGDLVTCLEKLFPSVVTGKWEFYCVADGTGITAASIGDKLDDNREKGSIVIDAAEFLPRMLNGIIYFSDVYIKLVGSPVEFGIFDSTFLYVIGGKETVETVAANFENTEIHEWRMGWKHYRVWVDGRAVYGGHRV